MRDFKGPVLLGLAAAVLAAACSEDETPPEPASCACSCTAADPVPHCVNTQNCRTTADCPTGTVCAPLPSDRTGTFPDAQGDDPLAACGAATPSLRCQLPSASMGRQSLTAGFEVPSFRLLRLESGGTAAFTWNPPDETHIVHCALFACPPVVREDVRDGRPVFQIDNYEHCVVAAQVFEPGEGVFDLGDRAIAFPSDPIAPGCGTPSPRFVHELMAGCWAYDKTKIIAATPLEPVSPAQIYDYGDRFDLDCSTGAEGRTCAWTEQRLGICHDGACRAPCVTTQDCAPWEQPPSSDAGAGEDAGTDGTDLVCFKSGGYVGVCVAPAETRTGVSR